MQLKAVFLGNKPVGYNCLRTLIGCRDVEVVGVGTRDPRSDVWWEEEYRVASLAKGNDLPIIPISEIKDLKPDFLFSIQYHEIIKKEILNVLKYGAINLHMAPLPEYRGCNQFSFAIINEEEEFGTTLHYMDEGVDSGDIINQKRFSIPTDCTVKELYDITEEKSVKLFDDTIDSILNRENDRIPQSELLDNHDQHFYLREDIEEVKELRTNWSQEKIYKYVRALDFPPFEPPFFKIDGKKVYLTLDYEIREK